MGLTEVFVHSREVLAERLASHTLKTTGCWLWQGPFNEKGYGLLWFKKMPIRAHRVAYWLAFGPTALPVLHSCDTPACVRPSHLRAGTQIQNLAEMRAKGRSHGMFAAGGGRT